MQETSNVVRGERIKQREGGQLPPVHPFLAREVSKESLKETSYESFIMSSC